MVAPFSLELYNTMDTDVADDVYAAAVIGCIVAHEGAQAIDETECPDRNSTYGVQSEGIEEP